MAQENTSSSNDTISPPAVTSSDSMSPNTGSPVAKGKSVVVVVKTEVGEDQGGSAAVTANGSAAADKVARAAAGGRRGDREVHIVTERERRKRMSEMFGKLHSLLPGVPDKIDKSSIVIEAIQYIKGLEVTLGELEKRKLEMGRRCDGTGESSSITTAPAAAPPLVMPVVAPSPVHLPANGGGVSPVGLQTWSAKNVVLSLSGDDAYINVCVARRRGVMTMVASVLEKHGIDVVTSGISSDASRSMFNIHARINGRSRRFGHNLPSEDIYKLAVSEIMVWLSD